MKLKATAPHSMPYSMPSEQAAQKAIDIITEKIEALQCYCPGQQENIDELYSAVVDFVNKINETDNGTY